MNSIQNTSVSIPPVGYGERLEILRTRLVYSQPYYALVLSRCSIRWSDKVPTAGVRVTGAGTIELAINPSFFMSLSDEHATGLLIHECLHLFMNHLARGRDLNKRLANIAMDIAINQYIPVDWLPNGALLPERYGFPAGESFEAYYKLILEKQAEADANGGDGQPEGEPLDEHGYGAGDELPDDVEQAVVEAARGDIADKVRSKFPGKMPQHIERMLKDLTARAELNWKQILRRFIGRSLSQERESTRTRLNRRLGFAAQGLRREYTPRICVALDESGSVSNEDHDKFIAELKSILKNADDATTVLHFDTEISHIDSLRSARAPVGRHSSGGTDFTCVMEHASKARPDLVIVFTDAEAPAPKTQPRGVPVIWAVVGSSGDEHLTGMKVRIK